MIAVLTNILPIIVGFFAKLIAIRSKAQSDIMKMAILGNKAEEASRDAARSYDTPAAAFNRRTLIWFLMAMIGLVVAGGAFLDVPVFVEQEIAGASYLFGLFQEAAKTEWIEISGIVAHEDLWKWMTMIMELYFGASLAKS